MLAGERLDILLQRYTENHPDVQGVQRVIRDLEDQKKREEVEAKNRLDHAVFSTERTLKENRESLDAGIVKDVEDALAGARSVLGGNDARAMRDAAEKLNQASHRMAEALYRKTAAGAKPQNGEAPAGPSESSDEDVVDAEYTEVS